MNFPLIKIEELKLNEKNPRDISEKAFEKLKKDVQDLEFWKYRPIIASNRTGENIIWCGNMRYRAAVASGMKEVVAVIENLSEEKEKDWLLKDNSHRGENVQSLLQEYFTVSELEHYNIEIIPVSIFVDEIDQKQIDRFDNKEVNIGSLIDSDNKIQCPKCNFEFSNK